MTRRLSHDASADVEGYLARGERVVLEMKQHWARLLPAIAATFAGFVLAVLAGLLAPAYMGALTNAAWWIWAVLLLVLAWRVFEWHHETFVVTTKRLILVHGLFVKKVAMMPLGKVTDMSYNRSIPARILGYGTFVLESAGQDQALSEIHFVRDPDARYREICGLIFDGDTGEDDRTADDVDSDLYDYAEHETRGADDEAFPSEHTSASGRRNRSDQADPTHFAASARDYDGWEGSPRARRGNGHRDIDDTDPYGSWGRPGGETEHIPVTVFDHPDTYDLDHTYAETQQSAEPMPDEEDGSAWTISREHATRPQTVRPSRDVNTLLTNRDER